MAEVGILLLKLKLVVTFTTGIVKVLVRYSLSTHVIENPWPANVHGLLQVMLYVPLLKAMWCSGTPGHLTDSDEPASLAQLVAWLVS